MQFVVLCLCCVTLSPKTSASDTCIYSMAAVVCLAFFPRCCPYIAWSLTFRQSVICPAVSSSVAFARAYCGVVAVTAGRARDAVVYFAWQRRFVRPPTGTKFPAARRRLRIWGQMFFEPSPRLCALGSTADMLHRLPGQTRPAERGSVAGGWTATVSD